VKKKWIFIPLGVLVLGAVVFSILNSNRTQQHEVEMAEVGYKELTATVTSSGTIHPKRSVDVSTEVMGRVTELAVVEGETVREGDFLLRIDATALEAAVSQNRADLALAEASAEKAEQDLRRTRELHDKGLQPVERLEAAQTTARIERARVLAASSRLENALDELAKAEVTASMSGVITRLNVEEGESAIMGTLNNPGTVLLVIADLSTMEARVKVDETEVVKVAIGQTAEIEIDAFADSTFSGRVTEIGNSPIYSSSGSSQQAVDFEVKITLEEEIPNIRPGLSAKAEIEVAHRDSALAVPLGAVVVRKWPPEERTSGGRRDRRLRERRAAVADSAADSTRAAAGEVERKDTEGVFVVEEGIAGFRPLEIGIAGADDFEVLSGLQEGQTVVTGPFRILRDLKDGDAVKKGRSRKGGSD